MSLRDKRNTIKIKVEGIDETRFRVDEIHATEDIASHVSRVTFDLKEQAIKNKLNDLGWHDLNSPATYPKKVTCEDCGGEQMKVLYSSGEQRYLNSVPMKMLIPYENQAIINHSQTLARLNERGGLGLHEMYAIMNDGLLPSKGKFEAVMKIPIGTILKSLDCPSCTDGWVYPLYEQVVREENTDCKYFSVCKSRAEAKDWDYDAFYECATNCKNGYIYRTLTWLEIASEVEATEKMGMRQAADKTALPVLILEDVKQAKAEDFGPPVPCIESAIKTFQGKEVIERLVQSDKEVGA
jgi:hypothetical protein